MNAAHYLEQYQSFDLPGQDLPWLAAIRQAARACFAAGGFPSPREEEWKYTNVSTLEKKRFAPLQNLTFPEIDEVWLSGLRLPDAWSLVLADGLFMPELSRLEGLPDGLVATGMAEALRAYPERVEARLGAAQDTASHGFLAFNTAFFADGAFVDIPAGLILEKPLHILHLRLRPEGLANVRSSVQAGANAQATLIETYAGIGDIAYLTAAVTEIVLGENAKLEHAKVQTETGKAYHFGGLYAKQARHSRFVQHNLAFGGLLARTEIATELATGAECELNGLFLGQGRQHLDSHTTIRHAEPHGLSRETYRGVLAERARGVFQGRILVQPQAQKTAAEMNSRNLLLSDEAEIDAKPQLEILADDVKCAHGVAIGRLDAESLFYLESRGVDRESARNMLTFAFAHSMIEKIGPDSLRAHAQDLLLQRFPQAGIRRDWL